MSIFSLNSFLKYLAYAAFFMFAFVISLYLTFPWGVAKDRALAEASRATGMDIQAKSLVPNWVTGVVAKDVEITTGSLNEPLKLDSLNARVHLLPFLTGGVGGTVSLPIAQGTLDAEVVDSKSKTEVSATIEGVQIALIPGLKESLGVPLSGTLSLDMDVELDKAKPESSSGVLHLKGSALELLKGGKVGGMTLPFELAIGDFDWTIPVEQGKAKLTKLGIKGDSVELELDGTITLAAQPERSVLNLVVKFKPSEAFLKKEPLLGALLNNIRNAKGSDGFYAYALTGSAKHPRFFPKRGG